MLPCRITGRRGEYEVLQTCVKRLGALVTLGGGLGEGRANLIQV